MECIKEDIQLIFRIRSNMTKVKMNRKQMFKSHECSKCLKEFKHKNTHITVMKFKKKWGKKENLTKC